MQGEEDSDGDEDEEEGVEEEEASGPRARALRVPRNVTEGSSGFQQFFWIYAKLMAGLKDSIVNESRTTPQTMHKAEMSVENARLEKLD